MNEIRARFSVDLKLRPAPHPWSGYPVQIGGVRSPVTNIDEYW
eukprot:COSAG01_NODE_5212_length_4407_cov_3.380919_4_plen_43_part_00